MNPDVLDILCRTRAADTSKPWPWNVTIDGDRPPTPDELRLLFAATPYEVELARQMLEAVVAVFEDDR